MKRFSLDAGTVMAGLVGAMLVDITAFCLFTLGLGFLGLSMLQWLVTLTANLIVPIILGTIAAIAATKITAAQFAKRILAFFLGCLSMIISIIAVLSSIKYILNYGTLPSVILLYVIALSAGLGVQMCVFMVSLLVRFVLNKRSAIGSQKL